MARQLADFLGQWRVDREIEDARAGAVSRFEGHAELRAQGAGEVLYQETGVLIMAGQRYEAERRYLWRARDSQIDVLFEDGRMFHEFDPEHGGQATEHLCGEDMYCGGYDFTHWPAWRVTWDVSGPRKSYRSVSRYSSVV